MDNGQLTIIRVTMVRRGASWAPPPTGRMEFGRAIDDRPYGVHVGALIERPIPGCNIAPCNGRVKTLPYGVRVGEALEPPATGSQDRTWIMGMRIATALCASQ